MSSLIANLTSNTKLLANLTSNAKLIAETGFPSFMDNIYKLSISSPPDFDGQYGFDILSDTTSTPNSIKNDLYVGYNGTWHLLKEMTFTSTDLNHISPPNLIRLVESDANIGLAWTAQRTTGYLDRIRSREFVTAYNAVRVKIAARAGTELKLSDYATLQVAIEALNYAGDGSQLNIDQDITTVPTDVPPNITPNDIVIYSDNQSVIKIGDNSNADHTFHFLGNDVHAMGINIDLNKNNQTNNMFGVYNNGCVGFSVIGCDIRNSSAYNFECVTASDGVYGACIGTVSGDDVFTAVVASSNITFEFCVGGCSDNVFGSSSAFELEDGDDYCTIYKCIAFGQIKTSSFNAHIHPGNPSITNMLMEECVNIYNSYAYSWDGDNIGANTIEDSTIYNCRDVFSYVEIYSHNFRDIKNCEIQGNQFYQYSEDENPTIIVKDSEGVEVLDNACSKIWLTDCELLTISDNIVCVKSPSDTGISLNGVNNSTIGVNNFRVKSPINPIAIFIKDSNDNVIDDNVLVKKFGKGIYFSGTSDGNTGSGNNLTKAIVEVFDDSSGVNVIS